jgi:hypothetical protein
LTFTLGSGEHGIGLGKKEFLVDELGEGTVELMRTIKSVIDPLDLMNPGKVACFAILLCISFFLRFKYPSCIQRNPPLSRILMEKRLDSNIKDNL